MAELTIVEQPNPLVVTIEVPGPPGPANILAVGSVISGEEADATITGTYPNQELNLVLPIGPRGPSGDMQTANAADLTGTVDLSDADYAPSITKVLTLTGNVVFINEPPAPEVGMSGTTTLVLKQAASGGPFTVAWPTIEWAENASAPVMPTTASAELEVHLFHNGVTLRGKVGGTYYP